MAILINRKLLPPLLLILIILVASCGQPPAATPTVDTVATIVAATMQALDPQTGGETSTQASSTEPVATFTPLTSESGTPTITATPGAGIASGGVYGYPFGALPRLVVVAFNEDHLHWNYIITDPGSSYYSMDLVAGKYQIVAYDADGHAGGCITIVTVKDKETATCDITDWVSNYLAKPGDAPNP